MNNEDGDSQMNKTLKITLVIVAAAIFLLVAAALFLPKIIASAVYKDNFEQRFETYEPMARSLDEFDGLRVSEYTFKSDKGQKLAGYKYYRDTEQKGAIVIAHGFGGGGHNSYMDIADYFTSCGYVVFAYDATGNDKSGGEAVGGMPQGVIDLEYALRFVKSTDEFAELPIMLWGHSWGAYSVGSVLKYHPDVKAVIMAAGFDSSADIIGYQGRQIAGDAGEFILPYMLDIEKEKFGEYASASCTEGFESSEARVMLIRSRDDEMIPYGDSFGVFQEKFGGNPRFEFVSLENRGHNYIWYADSVTEYREIFNSEFDEYMESAGGFTPERKAEYLKEHLDKKQRYALDYELMEKMSKFYDSSIGTE